MSTEVKPLVKATDMEKDEQDRVLQLVIEGLKESIKEHKQEKVVSRFLKNEMDKASGSGWNCIVGKNFGAHVIHQAKKYIFFQVKELSILLWKA